MRVRKRGGATRHHRLSPVHFGHLQTAPGKPPRDGCGDFRILRHRQTERLGDDVSSQIVIGRPEATCQDHQVGALQRFRENGAQALAVVTDDRLAFYLDPEAREFLRDEQRVRVEPRPAQQLAADCDDFRGGESAAHEIQPGSSHIVNRSDRFAYTAAIASSAITPRPPCSASSRPAGYGLMMS